MRNVVRAVIDGVPGVSAGLFVIFTLAQAISFRLRGRGF